jgi:Tfp pilus assembly protein PilO
VAAKPDVKPPAKKQFKFELDPQIREKLVPLAVVVIIGIGSVLFGSRILGNIYRQQQELRTQERQLALLQSKVVQLQETSDAALQGQVAAFEQVLPSTKPALNLLSALSRLAREQGVILSAITLNPGRVEEAGVSATEVERKQQAEKPKPQDFTLEFSVEGSLSQVGTFISGLERTAPVMTIEEFSLGLVGGRVDEETGEFTPSRVKADLSIQVHWQKTPETIGAVEQPLAQLSEAEEQLFQTLQEFALYETVQPKVPTGKTNLFAPPLFR